MRVRVPSGQSRSKQPVPSLAGVAAMRGLQIFKIAEAELLRYGEGRVCAVDIRDGVAPPGSKTASRAKGRARSGPSSWSPMGSRAREEQSP
jgi:hypothetical protein